MSTDLLRPASRSEQLGFSDIVKIRNRVIEMLGRGLPVLRLEGGEPFAPTADFVKLAMKDALDRNETRYAPSSGIPQLIEAIRQKLTRKNAIEATPGEVIVTSGGAHGLFCAFQTTVNPGDGVMLFSPYWTPIRDHINYAGGIPVRVPWADARGVSDLQPLLESHLTPGVRVIYVNTPSNPTGDVLSRSQLESIAAFAVSHDLAVISDEAYEDLVYDGEHVSLASLPGMAARTLSVFTLSKSYAMTGWRVGYVVAANPWMDVLRKLVLNSINGVSTPSQFAAVAALTDTTGWMDERRVEYRQRRDRMVTALNEAGLKVARPAGAFYLFSDVRDVLGDDSWAAMETLLARTSIASVPGIVFGPEGEGHLRMSFSLSMNTIDAAVAALAALRGSADQGVPSV